MSKKTTFGRAVIISPESHLLLKELIKKRRQKGKRATMGLCVEQLISEKAIEENVLPSVQHETVNTTS